MSNDKAIELIHCLSIGTVFRVNGYLIAKCLSGLTKEKQFEYRDCITHKVININDLLDGSNNITIIGYNKTEFVIL